MEVDGMSATYLLDLLPGEVEAAVRDGNDTVLLPILSIEQHGPHLLLGTDGYGSLALAQELSAATGALALPPIPFCWEGCTNVFPGGIGVREEEFLAYLRSVVKGLWRGGFRHIVILNTHGGNYYAMRLFPQQMLAEEGIPVLTIYGLGPSREAHELLEAAGGEAGALTGSLRLLGREDLVAKAEETNRKAVAEFGDDPKVLLDPPAAREARHLGNVGHDYSHECFHVQPNSRLDTARATEAMKLAAESMVAIVQDYRAYVDRLLTEGAVTTD
jgi:creatinine amidohydrolase